jgi:hypothetical protein
MDGNTNTNDNRNLLARTGAFSLTPTTFAEAERFAKLVADSELAPKDYRGKPGNVLVAMQMGAELGLSPMQALQNIAVINGRPSVWGDAMLALCQAHPDFEDLEETDDGNQAVCKVRRRGRSVVTGTFSMADAKKANLDSKQGPWTQYPRRMRQMRARGFALRDAFADVLRGLIAAEEAADLPVDATPRKPAQRLAAPIDQRRVIDVQPDKPATVAAAAVTQPQVEHDDYVIPTGKNAGRALRELNNQQLHWYAEEYRGRDAELKRKARAVIDARKALAAEANKQQLAEMGDNDAWGMTTGDGEPAFLGAIAWAGAGQWSAKPLSSADLDTLLLYGAAVQIAIDGAPDGSDDLIALTEHIGDVEAAIDTHHRAAEPAT